MSEHNTGYPKRDNTHGIIYHEDGSVGRFIVVDDESVRVNAMRHLEELNPVIQIPSSKRVFQFDGHEFLGDWKKMPVEQAPFFDIAYRARRGDASAIAVANACGLYIVDANGNLYVDYR